MAEFEELKITVSLVDNASAKLKEANTQIDQVGKETGKRLSEQFRTSTTTIGEFGKQLRGVAEAFNVFGNLPILKLAGGAGGFAGIILAIKQTNDALGDFAKELLALRDVSRAAGLLPDQFKNISGQLRLIGYSTDQAKDEITNFFRGIEEAARPGTAQFQRVWRDSFNPEATMVRINELRGLIRNGQPGRAMALAAAEARAIYTRELNRPGGGGMQEARRQAEGWLSTIGLTRQALGITDVSDFIGDPQKWQRRIDAAERFNREYELFNKTIGGIINDIKFELLPLFQDLNTALAGSGGAFGSFRDIVSTDIDDLRKIIAILEGDWQKLASLLPPGPLRRLITGNMGSPGEVQGPPDAFGTPPWGAPGTIPIPSGTGFTPEQAERNRRRFRGRRTDESLEQNNKEGALLLEEIKRLNSNLFEAQVGTGANPPTPQGPAFHNSPQGGAEGESNPMQLPPGSKQPGGGATSEALLRPWRPGDPITGKFRGKPYPYLNPALGTPLPPRAGEKNPIFSGVSEGRGVASWFGQGKGWGDKPGMDKPGSNALRVPEHLQGISLSDPKTLGQFFYVKDPLTGETRVEQQTDAGPGVRTQKIVDISVAAAQEAGYTKASFEAMQGRVERGALPPWEVTPTGFGTGRSTAPAPQGKIPTVETQRISQAGAREDLPSGMDLEFNPFQRSGDDAMIAQRAGGGFNDFNDDLPGMTFAQRAKYGRMAGRRLPDSPMSTNVEDRRRSDLSGDPGGLEGTGDLGPFNPDDYDLPNAERRTRWPMRQGPGLGEQLGYGDVGRRQMDQALGHEAGLDASANLDVNIRGPAGVETKVDGDGMFKGNTAVNRQIDLE